MHKSLFYSLLALFLISTSINAAESYTKIDASTLKECIGNKDFYVIDTREVTTIAKGYIANSLIIQPPMFKWVYSLVPGSSKIIIISDKKNYSSTMKKYIDTKKYQIVGYCIYDEVIQYPYFNTEKIEYNPNTYKNIETIIKNKETIIDIRNIEEYKETGVIKEALLVPISTFMKQGYKKIPTKGKVYVYCYGGNRAVVAMSFIKRAGYTNKFYIMKNGLLNAIQEGYPLVPYSG